MLSVLLPSWRLHLEAASLSPRARSRAYPDDRALFVAFLARQGMPAAARSIRREHVEAFIAVARAAAVDGDGAAPGPG